VLSSFAYWRLSGFYFFYFAVLGAYIPYWGLYLESSGFSAPEIGLLTGVVMATKVVAPSLWGFLADISGQRLRIVRLGSGLACLCFCGIFVSSGFAGLMLVVTAYSFFWNAVLAQFEVITLDHLGSAYNRYSQIRVWGSVGFIGAVVGLGWLFDVVAITALPVVMAGLLAAIWLCSLRVADTDGQTRHPGREGLAPVLRRTAVWAFFLVCFLLQVAHGPYYTFFSLYLESLDYSRSTIGWLWALGVLAEVALFLCMHRVLPRFGVRNIMLLSLCLAALRWLLIGYGATSMPLLLIAQCLHAASFGAFHAVSIEFIRRQFPPGLAGQGQAIYSGLSFGAGGAAGAVMSGYLWQQDPQFTFVIASLASALAALIAWRFIGEPANRL
jgi:PPP family 3-phenylpropionic acid transporter